MKLGNASIVGLYGCNESVSSTSQNMRQDENLERGPPLGMTYLPLH